MSGIASNQTMNSTAVFPTSGHNETSWDELLLAFEVLNVLQLTTVAWVLACMVCYGTKTHRWMKKPGGSSLSSGMVYTTCTIAVALYIPKLIATEVLYSLPRIDGLESCELVCDVSNAAYTFSTSATYFYLWLRQRLIYEHPYVKERANRRVKWFSNFVLVLLGTVAAALLSFYVAPTSYSSEPFGCVSDKDKDNFFSGKGKNILLALVLLSSQIMILCLSIYPVLRVKFNASQCEGIGLSPDLERADRNKSVQDHLNTLSALVHHVTGTENPKSPIELAVRRTMVSSIVIVVSDVAALAITSAIPASFPAVLRCTIYDLGSFFNIFCMLTTFGFASRVLTLPCPTCPETRCKTRGKGAE